MSLTLTCDGPGCDKRRPPNNENPDLPPGTWLRLTQNHIGRTSVRDFCSLTCLGAWHYCTTTPDACK